jgi:hypothetical protein
MDPWELANGPKRGAGLVKKTVTIGPQGQHGHRVNGIAIGVAGSSVDSAPGHHDFPYSACGNCRLTSAARPGVYFDIDFQGRTIGLNGE